MQRNIIVSNKQSKMNVLACIVFSMLFVMSCCLSYPQRPDPKYPPRDYSASQIVKHENNLGFANYNFSYETSDGSQREETAELKNAGSEKEALAVHGSYTYVGTDGVTYKVTYVADENGYRASGEHIPKTESSFSFYYLFIGHVNASE